MKLGLLFRSDAEQIADALAGIKADLERKPVIDPKVWGGYHDGWRPGDEDDEDDPRMPVGLFLNLERCTRGDPSWQMAMAIETAFELGKAAIVGKADPVAAEQIVAGMEAMANGRRNGGLTTGGDARADAEGRHRALKEVWVARREQFSGRELAEKVCAHEFGFVTDLSEERVRALFSKWAREAVDATERDTWATSCWIASKNGSEHRYTQDNYRVLLVEEDRSWRLLVEIPDGTEVRPRGSDESLDAAKVDSYAIVEALRDLPAKRTGKIATRARSLPSSTSRPKSRR
jgi:hypothetical protein